MYLRSCLYKLYLFLNTYGTDVCVYIRGGGREGENTQLFIMQAYSTNPNC